jgi:regulator of replication initiation timing
MGSTDTDLPANAIVIDLRIQADEARAKKLMSKFKIQVSDEDWETFIEYMTSEISYRLVTEDNSPVIGAMKDALSQYKLMIINDFEELDSLVEAQEEVIVAQNSELDSLRKKVSMLASENKTLSSSLTRLRKLLKADEVKEALSFCDKLQKQSVVGEIGQVAVLLADGVKNALITIKGI